MKKGTVFFLFSFILAGSAFSQVSMFKALYIFNFTKYVNWQDNIVDDFVICILGQSDITDNLIRISKTRKVNNKTLVVKDVNANGNLPKCDIIFVSRGSSNEIDKVSSYYKDSNTLIITEKNNSIAKGSCINMINTNGKIEFEISKNNCVLHHLIISEKLYALGSKID